MSTITLSGNTYNIRDMLKAKGARYNGATRTWDISAEAWERIRNLDNGRYARGVYPVTSAVGMDAVTAMMTLNGTSL